MFRILMTFFLISVVSTNANAQTIIRNFDPATVFRSMQCEVGLAARATKLDPGLKVHLKYTTSGSQEAKASAEAGFGGWIATIIQGPKLGAGYEFKRVSGNTQEGTLNLNQGNTKVCVRGKPSIPLGIYDCLVQGAPTILGGFTQSCNQSVTAKATFDASGKFTFWVITIGPSLSYGVTVTYTIDMDAPAPEKKG
jgi:hypothetical protein